MGVALNIEVLDDNVLINPDTGEVFEYAFYSNDDEEIRKFVKGIKADVRSSDEYRGYIAFHRETTMAGCAVKKNITSELEKVSIEVHHAPFTLDEVIEIVLRHHLWNNRAIAPDLLSQEILALHYQNLVGLVPLCKTIHQLVEKGQSLVLPEMIHGNVDAFLKRYPDGVMGYHTRIFNDFHEIGNQKFVESLKILATNPDVSWTQISQRHLSSEFIQHLKKFKLESGGQPGPKTPYVVPETQRLTFYGGR